MYSNRNAAEMLLHLSSKRRIAHASKNANVRRVRQNLAPQPSASACKKAYYMFITINNLLACCGSNFSVAQAESCNVLWHLRAVVCADVPRDQQ
jgi:hypothetical protein